MHLEIFGYELIGRKAATLQPLTTTPVRGGWSPLVREPFPGAWQQNAEVTHQTALSNVAVFTCVTLIAQDVAKLRLRLVQVDDEGIWHETTNPAWSPVLRKPNRYQTTQKFIEQWLTSKLITGNTYVLKERDRAGRVRALYVLDPTKVTPLVAPDGGVYYELKRSELAGLGALTDAIVVPASEIIHDLMVALFHPLVGVTPLYACGLAALQGNTITETSSKFFAGGSNPGGVLTAPGAIGDETAKRLKEYWDQNFTGANVGKVAVLGDGLKYEAMTVNAVDAQLIEQLRWTADTICACYHVPTFMVVGGEPPVNTVEPMLQQYYAQCIQALVLACESALDDGLGLGDTTYGTEFDVDDLIWMNTETRTKAASEAIGSGAMAPNEARKKYYGLGRVAGGDTPYMQQQNYSLAALDERDRNHPFAKSQPVAPPVDATPDDDAEADETATKHARLATLAFALLKKDWQGMSDGL